MNTLKTLPLCQETIDYVLSQPVQTGKAMFYGSSFFTRWGYDRARQQLAEATNGELDVLNHGFGGATIDQLLYMYPQLVAPYNPKEIVIRSGYNDINEGLTVDQSIFLLDRLITWLQKDFPDIRIYLLPVFDAKIMDESRHKAFSAYNEQMAELAKKTQNVEIFDINEFFYNAPEDIGNLSKLRDVFVKDGLHLTDEAYVEMAKFFGPHLLAMIK